MAEQRPMSVTEAMTCAKTALETIRIRVIGEVSEFNDKPGYKAAYFTVSDKGSAMPCLMWRDQYEASGVVLRCGVLVEIGGSFSAYVPKGRMQFQVRSLSLAGEGDLRLQVAAIARKLEAEGLMRPERKRALPRYPERIAVVTSPRGKAIHDVVRTLRRRYPLAELLVAGVAVEGADAPAAIVGGLQAAAACSPDVILLVRGGGSYEDLMPFSSEEVARAVAACPVPVVTGIGHEPDTSLSDMVSDLRASTPTAAAEAVSPDIADLSTIVVRERRALGQALQSRVRIATHRVTRLADRAVFSDPHIVIGPASQALDSAGMRLSRALPERLVRDEQRLTRARERMILAGGRLTQRTESGIALASARLHDLSPLAILGRGYSATFAVDGSVIKSIGRVSVDQRIDVRVADGTIRATVVATKELEK